MIQSQVVEIKRSFKKFFRLATVLVCVSTLIGCSATTRELKKYPITDKDTAGLVTFNTLNAIDAIQTVEILNNPMYTELTPFIAELGPEGALLFFVGKSILHYKVTEYIPPEHRKWWYLGSSVPAGVAVGVNASNGVGF